MSTNTSPVCPHAERLAKHLLASQFPLIVAHSSPDGDALGSMSALGFALKALGKEVMLYNASGLPEAFMWLPFPAPIHTKRSTLPHKPDLCIVLDCGDIWRMGPEMASAFPKYTSINIDHHLGNPLFGSLDNWVDPTMAATGQMVAKLLDALNVPLINEAAQGVYLALVSDTGSFTHGNTTPEVLCLAARLMELGLDACALRNKMDHQWTLSKMHLWGKLMHKVRLELQGQVAICAVTRQDIASAGAKVDDFEGFVEHMRRLKGVRVAMFAREETKNSTKISLRSSGDDDVRAVAAYHGGGGHKNAAGALISQDLHSVLRHVTDDIERMVLTVGD